MRMIIRAQRKMKHEGGRPKKANNEKLFRILGNGMGLSKPFHVIKVVLKFSSIDKR
jgi:hypothetical protein